MKRADIVSINIGKPIQQSFNNKEVSTGIYKTPILDPLFLSWSNLEGDGQADLIHHGGTEKAVCVYPYEHYPYWEKELQQELAPGAFGENLTIRGMTEDEVCIGDTFQIGDAIVQVSQPRQPCFKLSLRYGLPDLPLQVQSTGFTGFYFRVLKEGIVTKENGLRKVSSHPKGMTVSFANVLMHHQKDNLEGIQAILEVEELSTSWRKTFLKRLQGDQGNTKERLTGDRSE